MLCSVRGQAATSSPSNEGVQDDAGNDEVDVDAITAYALSLNDKTLLTCSHNNIIRQYSLEKIYTSSSSETPSSSSNVILTKNWGKSGHTLPVNLMQFHVSNVFVATGSVDGTAGIYDVRGGFVTHIYRPYQSADGGGSGRLSVTALEWMSDIHQLVIAIGRDDGSIAIHNLRQDKEVILLHEHVSAVTTLRWPTSRNDDTNLFISAGRDAVISLWKIEDTSKKKKKSNKQKARYHRIQTLPVYESIEGMVVLPCRRDRPDIVVATAGGKGRIRLWSTPVDNPKLSLMNEQPLKESFGEKRGGYHSLTYRKGFRRNSSKSDSAKAREELIVADAEHNISFVSLGESDQLGRLSTLRTIVGHNDEILDLKIIPQRGDNHRKTLSPESRRIVVATNSAQVRVFDLATFSCHVLDRHAATVLCVDVSPCGRYIATCGKDKAMRLWHVGSFQCIAVAQGHTEAVGSTALSRQPSRYDVKGKAATNGGVSFVVTVSVDRTIKRWNLPGSEVLNSAAAAVAAGDTESEIQLKAFVSARAHEKDINVVSIAPNDSLIATGSQDKTVKLWKATDLTLQATLSGHRRGVWDCQFSPHDRVLATASGDQTIKLWSLSDYTCVRTFQGHMSSVLRVRFLSFGMQLVSSGADGLLKVWTIRTNECETTIDGHNAKAWALDLASDVMVSGGADSRIVVWTDITKQEEDIKHAKREETMMMDQKLANHMRHQEYQQALNITLELDKPFQALRVFSAIIESDVSSGGSGIEPLRVISRGWSTDRLLRVLQYCREWNTRSRNSNVALLIVRAITSSLPIHELAAIDGLPEITAAIVPYAERHFERLDRLHESSFLLEYVLGSMGGSPHSNFAEDLAKWEMQSQFVLPSTIADGRVQLGGKTVVGFRVEETLDDEGQNDLATIGESTDSNDDSSDTGSVGSELG